MRHSIHGRHGVFHLLWWYEAPAGTRHLDLRELSLARAFVRRIASEPAVIAGLRAFLATGAPELRRLDDADVLEHLAQRIASRALLVAHEAPARLVAFDTDSEPPPPVAEVKIEEKTWIEIELLDMAGEPIPYERYWIQLTDGTTREGQLDARGRAYFGDLDPGECDVRWPALDKDATTAPGTATWTAPARSAGILAPSHLAPGDYKTWVEIELVDLAGQPVPNEVYRLKLPDGKVIDGRLDGAGRARIGGLDPGVCEVCFPDMDQEVWEQIG